MGAQVTVTFDAQAAVDLHTVIGRLREAEAESPEPSAEFDARLRSVARSLESGLRSFGYAPCEDGWERVPPSRRR